MALTLSFHQKANAVHRDHNIRNANAVQGMDHIDPSLLHENVILKDMRIREAYEMAYGAAVAEFQEEQKKRSVRSKRILEDYYNQVKNDVRRNICYEIIVQIGDRDTVGFQKNPGKEMDQKEDKIRNARLAEEIMREYVKQWDSLNANMFLFGAYIHADEKEGTIHMHLDYLPMAIGYKRGPKVQNGLARACEQNVKSRYTPAQIQGRMAEHNHKTGRTMNFTSLWQDMQRMELKRIAKEKGLDLTWDQDSLKKMHHLSTPEFKQKQEQLNALEKEIDLQKDKIQKNDVIIRELDEDIKAMKSQGEIAGKDMEELQKQIAAMKKEKKQVELQSVSLQKDCQQLEIQRAAMESEMNHYVEETQKLKEEKMNLEEESQKIRKDMDVLDADFKHKEDVLKKVNDTLLTYKEVQKKVEEYLEKYQKSRFSNTVKVSREEFEDILTTMETSMVLVDQRSMEITRMIEVAKNSINEKNKVLKEQQELIDAAVEPYKRELREKDSEIDWIKGTLRDRESKLEEYDWMRQLKGEEKKVLTQLKENVAARRKILERINQIDEKLMYAKSQEYKDALRKSRYKDSRWKGYIDEDALKVEQYKLMKKHGYFIPKEMQEYMDQRKKGNFSRERREKDLEKDEK